MSYDRIRPCVAVLSLVAGLYGTGFPSAGAADGYNLLRLGGTWVKWGQPALGKHAEVTYALAAAAIDYPKARNCSALEPMEPMLSRSGIALNAFHKELEFAFSEWSRAANITFRAVADTAQADIVIGAQRHPRGRAYSNVAYSANDHDGTRRITRSLICLNPALSWKTGFDGDLNVYDMRYTMIHEIGHAIGLDHPGPDGQMMSFRYHENFRRLQEGDVAGAAHLYGGVNERSRSYEQHAAGQAVSRKNGPTIVAPQNLSLGEK